LKPRVYLETTIPSYLVAGKSADVRSMANRDATQEWWKTRRSDFELYVPEFVLAEAALGDADAAKSRLDAIEGIPELEANEQVRTLAKALISDGPIPPKAEIDGYHIAIAAVNGIEYLLAWNCTHIANAAMRTKIESVCRRHGCEPPIMCTPLELMED
jgi:hypothetical protein